MTYLNKKYNILSKVTLLLKDAQIQYRPLSAAAKSSNEDVPMPMIDIQLPFNNHTHIVTWLDPKTMKPKSKPERSDSMQKEDARSKELRQFNIYKMHSNFSKESAIWSIKIRE